MCHCTSICSTQNSSNEGRDLLRNPDYYAIICSFTLRRRNASSVTQVKPWIVTQLRLVCDEMGIRSANLIAEMFERGEDFHP